MSEGFNTVMKRYLQWKGIPVDIIAHALLQLQVYYIHEVHRGFCGLSTYDLMPDYQRLQRPPDECMVMNNNLDPSAVANFPLQMTVSQFYLRLHLTMCVLACIIYFRQLILVEMMRTVLNQINYPLLKT